MYNNNGIALLNRTYMASSSSISYSSSINDLITFTDGSTNGNNALMLYYTSSTISIGTAANVIQKITPTQKYSSAYVKTTAVTSSYDQYGYFHVGYRDTPFSSDTYTDVPTLTGLAISATVTAGIPTITAYNTSTSDITVNEVTYLINAGITANSAKTVLLAGFHFPDITLAPGETYTFTIMNKNS